MLLTSTDISRIYNLSSPMWAMRKIQKSAINGFPLPVKKLYSGNVWDSKEVKAWFNNPDNRVNNTFDHYAETSRSTLDVAMCQAFLFGENRPKVIILCKKHIDFIF